MRASLILTVLAVCEGQAINISPKKDVPTDSSPVVHPQFIGFGIEAGSLPDYMGNKSHPNRFSLNMFESLANRTKSPLPIRVGGTSMDNSEYDPSQKDPVEYHPPSRPDGLRTPMSLGPSWIESLSLLDYARWTLQVPLHRLNHTNGIKFAKVGINAMQPGTFNALEIGNEPNLYPNSNEQEYVDQWKTYANLLGNNIDLPDGPDFWACSFSSQTDYTVVDAFQDGFNTVQDKIRAVSYHYYQTYTNFGIQGTLLNHDDTISKMDDQFAKPVNFTRSRSIPFVLGEVGSALKNGQKNPELQGSLGSAVWTVDFMLYAMTLGISRVNMQLLTAAAFSAWQPVADTIEQEEQPARVLGGWYGHVFVADILGAAKGKDLRVKENKLAGQQGPGSVVAYSIYHDGTLAQMAVLNEKLWVSGPDGPRSYENITLSVPAGYNKVLIQRLDGTNGTELENITFAGQRWSKASVGKPVKIKDDTTTLAVQDRSVTFKVRATEGLLVSLLDS